MNAFGEHRENAARLALRLQRRDGNHRGKKDGIACMPTQEKQYFVALRVHAIDAADSQNVNAHHGQRDPLRADKIDADEEYGVHELMFQDKVGQRCAVPNNHRSLLGNRKIDTAVVHRNGHQRRSAFEIVKINVLRL